MSTHNITSTIDHIKDCESHKDLNPFDASCYKPSALILADTLILMAVAPEGSGFDPHHYDNTQRYYASLNI